MHIEPHAADKNRARQREPAGLQSGILGDGAATLRAGSRKLHHVLSQRFGKGARALVIKLYLTHLDDRRFCVGPFPRARRRLAQQCDRLKPRISGGEVSLMLVPIVIADGGAVVVVSASSATICR